LIPGTRDEVIATIATRAPEWFRSADKPPEWIQEADWPMFEGRPMAFLGRIPIPSSAGLFHDDAMAFLFIATSGVTETVIQTE
jgi:hypothetical protein